MSQQIQLDPHACAVAIADALTFDAFAESSGGESMSPSSREQLALMLTIHLNQLGSDSRSTDAVEN